MTGTAIELDGVDSGYGANQVLHGLSMTVASDRVNCMIGPNGSGKSTAIKSINGLVPVWDGTVTGRAGADLGARAGEVVVRVLRTAR